MNNLPLKPQTSAWLLTFVSGLVILGAGFLWLVGCVSVTPKDVICLGLDGVAIAAICPTAAVLFDWFDKLDMAGFMIAVVTIIGTMAMMGLINLLRLFDYSGSASSGNFNSGLICLGVVILGFSNYVGTGIYSLSVEKLKASPPRR